MNTENKNTEERTEYVLVDCTQNLTLLTSDELMVEFRKAKDKLDLERVFAVFDELVRR